MRFDWQKDYGPYWQPGCTAFWLQPESHEIRPGIWPMPFTMRNDLPVYDKEECIWLYEGEEVVAFNYELVHDGHWMCFRSRKPVWISDEDLGWTSGFRKRGGYLGKAFYAAEKKRIAEERRERADSERRNRARRGSLLRRLALWPN